MKSLESLVNTLIERAPEDKGAQDALAMLVECMPTGPDVDVLLQTPSLAAYLWAALGLADSGEPQHPHRFTGFDGIGEPTTKEKDPWSK